MKYREVFSIMNIRPSIDQKAVLLSSKPRTINRAYETVRYQKHKTEVSTRYKPLLNS